MERSREMRSLYRCDLEHRANEISSYQSYYVFTSAQHALGVLAVLFCYSLWCCLT